MINVSEAKKDAAFVYQGQKWIVLKQGFVKQARGAGIYILKCRNLLTNGISEFTIKSGENLEEVSIEKKKAQYLYNDGSGYIFMDIDDFSQFEFSENVIGDQKYFLIEGLEYYIMYLDGTAKGVILPPKVDLKVAQAEPGAKGDTAGNAQKEAVTETGYTLRVPLFIKEGDVIRINTETGLYSERAN
ncbi:elongation factor P [Candidatus Peregrinibacteria bacterium RIFOXYC2_FULL_33_13]|nr:MAG: Elongation factor P [Candidatus Peregrinibacteria bacterium GW2011_GWA2_33_10]KKP41246.1 MAG: elongation factor P, elongation factor P [Candidatus Peregrinibacteria bacterium GW2011_GWC2_33_13]OGJ55395.1 MAG: elongation factor P [Candidatus Peregrinibacteria bacterium RIFOXYC2_FULL_33_13]